MDSQNIYKNNPFSKSLNKNHYKI